MADCGSPQRKRCREDALGDEEELDGYSSGQDGIFPSEDETVSEYACEGEYLFPSEDTQGSFDLTEPVCQPSNDDNRTLSDCSLSDESCGEDNVDEELAKIGKLMVSACCDKSCLRHLTVQNVMSYKSEYDQCKRSTHRKKWLFNKLRENSSESTKGAIATKFFVAGREVCQRAWCKLFSVSHRKIQRMQSQILFHDRTTALEHGNSGKKRQNTKTEAAVAWMDRYFNLIGDRMQYLKC